MQITCVCNAGLIVECDGHRLFVDLPNDKVDPFARLDDSLWEWIVKTSDPLKCGFFYTHDHPDHYDEKRLKEFLKLHPHTQCCMPASAGRNGAVRIGPFAIEYFAFEHAPMPMAPPHVTAVVSAGGKRIYIAADAKLDCEEHSRILQGQRVDAAFWNSMYLSRPDTRKLLRDAADINFIYHMPIKRDDCGMWKKLNRNLERYGDELENISVIPSYPTTINLT